MRGVANSQQDSHHCFDQCFLKNQRELAYSCFKSGKPSYVRHGPYVRGQWYVQLPILPRRWPWCGGRVLLQSIHLVPTTWQNARPCLRAWISKETFCHGYSDLKDAFVALTYGKAREGWSSPAHQRDDPDTRPSCSPDVSVMQV